MTRHRGLPALMTSALLLLAGCGDDGGTERTAPATDKTVRRAEPLRAAPPRKAAKAKAGRRRGKRPAFLANVLAGTMDSKLRDTFFSADRPVGPGDKLAPGDLFTTGPTGRAQLSLHQIGTITLVESTQIFVPKYGPCGAILVHGAAELAGGPRDIGKNDCRIHTPAAAVSALGETAIVVVADNGAVRIGTPRGPITWFDLEGSEHEIAGGTQIAIGPDGSPGKATPLVPVVETVSRTTREWMAQNVVPAGKGASAAARTLDSAGRILNRLTLDIDRLIELKELNRKAAEQRRVLAASPTQRTEDLVAVNSRLVEQAKEMVDLQEKGALQIHRAQALLALAGLIAAGSVDVERRVISLDASLDGLRQRLPPLFERKDKHQAAPSAGRDSGPAGSRR